MEIFEAYFKFPEGNSMHSRLAVTCRTCRCERTEILELMDHNLVAQCPVCFTMGRLQFPRPEHHHPDMRRAVEETKRHLKEKCSWQRAISAVEKDPFVVVPDAPEEMEIER